MAGVNEINLNPEQRAIESAGQASREDDFASKLVDSLDLPASLSAGIEEANEKAKKGEPDPNENEEEEAELEKPEETEEEEKSEEDEDLIPKSKVQKRMDEMTAQNKRLQAQLNQFKQKEQEAQPKEDSEQKLLESKSEDELRSLKRQVKILQIKNSSDDTKVAELLDLEEKIENTLKSAPIRFQRAQVSQFQEAIQNASVDVENFDKVGNDIVKYAQAIYQKSPSFQKSVSGQADALNLAVDYFKELSKISAGKSKEEDLKRQVNTFKKKVSVDMGSQKKSQDEDSSEKSFRKAKYGDIKDKESWIKTKINVNQLVDPEFLSRYQ